MNINIFQVPEGQRRAGMWTFTIDDQETLWYSSNREGVLSKVGDLMNGPAPGSVRLKALTAKQKAMGGKEGTTASAEDTTLPTPQTREERIAAFLSRGKLAQKEE